MLNYQLDRTFAALADPARRTIVERLASGPATVSELAKPLPMSLPAVMLHLKVLEESGMVRSEKIGRVRTFQVEPAGLRRTEDWFRRRRTTAETRLDRLGEHLADQAEPPKENP